MLKYHTLIQVANSSIRIIDEQEALFYQSARQIM